MLWFRLTTPSVEDRPSIDLISPLPSSTLIGTPTAIHPSRATLHDAGHKLGCVGLLYEGALSSILASIRAY